MWIRKLLVYTLLICLVLIEIMWILYLIAWIFTKSPLSRYFEIMMACLAAFFTIAWIVYENRDILPFNIGKGSI